MGCGYSNSCIFLVSVVMVSSAPSCLFERKVGVPLRSDSTSTVDSTTDNVLHSPALSKSSSSTVSFENNAMKRQLYKTKICRHNLIGRCKYNDNCFFAHSAQQIVPRIDFRKTKLCSKANCHDFHCLYAHNVEEIRDPYAPLCPDWVGKGVCSNGTGCKYSHNLTHLEELALTSTTNPPSSRKASTASSSPVEMPTNGLLSTPDDHLSESYSSTGGSTPELEDTAEDMSAEDLVMALVQMLSVGGPRTSPN